MTDPSLLETLAAPGLGFAGVVVGALGVWHANRTKTAAENANAARDDTLESEKVSDARLLALLEQQRADFEVLLEPMRNQIAGLDTKVTALESALDYLRACYRDALDHIRDLRRRWNTGDPLPAPPQSIRDEV